MIENFMREIRLIKGYNKLKEKGIDICPLAYIHCPPSKNKKIFNNSCYGKSNYESCINKCIESIMGGSI